MQSPAVLELVDVFRSACEAARDACGAEAIVILGDGVAIPDLRVHRGFVFARLAGKRAVLAAVFREDPGWLARAVAFGDSPPMSVEEVRPGETLMRWRPEADPAATLASLRVYVDAALEVFVAAFPADAALFPELDDAAISRMFSAEHNDGT